MMMIVSMVVAIVAAVERIVIEVTFGGVMELLASF